MEHKISVLVICYKQENLIKRALDSLLQQKEYIHEICVSDDCSPDKTWDILKEYEVQYPGLFKLHRNEPNVGIFENIEHTWTMPTGDLIYQLSGDDAVPDGWFKTVSDYISINNLDYKNENICIYGDFRLEYPNVDILIRRNDVIESGVNSLRLAVRGIVFNRSCVYSKKILEQFFLCSKGRSYAVEFVQDRQLQLYTDKAFYMPYVGNVYFANIGVSTTINKNSPKTKEREQAIEYAIAVFKERGIIFNRSDIYYLKYLTVVAKLRRNKSLLLYLKAIFLFSISLDLRLGKKNLLIFKLFVFALLRKIPHKKPLKFSI